jgi:hypothetical protein
LNEPWDSEHNKKLISLMPDFYRSPGSAAAAEFKTRYLVVRGPKTLFPATEKVSVRHVRDGTSNTIMLVQAAEDNAVIWTKPVDHEFDPDKPAAGLGADVAGSRGPASYFWVVMADGSVHRVPVDIPKDQLTAFFTRDGGETVGDISSLGRRDRPVPLHRHKARSAGDDTRPEPDTADDGP